MIPFALLLAVSPASAHEGEDHPPIPPEEAPLQIPEDLGGVVVSLQEHRARVQTSVDANTLGDLHPLCERMTKLAVALTLKAKGKDSAQRAAIGVEAATLKKVLGELHHAADHADTAGVVKALEQLDASLGKLAPYAPAAPATQP